MGHNVSHSPVGGLFPARSELITYTQVKTVFFARVAFVVLFLQVRLKDNVRVQPVIHADIVLFFPGICTVTRCIVILVVTRKHAKFRCKFIGWFDLEAFLLICPDGLCAAAINIPHGVECAQPEWPALYIGMYLV